MTKTLVMSGLLQSGKFQKLEVDLNYLHMMEEAQKVILNGIKKAVDASTPTAPRRMYRGQALDKQHIN